MRHWLFKSEPSVYSIDDLKRDGQTFWSGVRNYQARNFLRDEMKSGDLGLFYHSSAEPAGVAGLCQVVRGGYPDPSAADPDSPYFDPAHTLENPRWYVVDVAFVERWKRVLTLAELKADAALSGMLVIRKGMRLSVQPVADAEFERVVAQGRALAGGPSAP